MDIITRSGLPLRQGNKRLLCPSRRRCQLFPEEKTWERCDLFKEKNLFCPVWRRKDIKDKEKILNRILHLRGRWAKLLGDSIFVFDSVSEVFYEFESQDIAQKAWNDIIKEYSKKPTYIATKIRMPPDEIVTQICENKEYIKYLITWP